MASQRGNILFLILLAIILFAALTYAVNSGMRGGGTDASKESVPGAVAEIMSFLTATENAVNRMRLVGGIKPESLSFAYNYQTYGGTLSYSFDSPYCSADTCRVFKPAGGGVEARTFEKYAVPDPVGITAGNVKPGYLNFVLMQFPYAGTDANDLVLLVTYLKTPYCIEFNRAQGIVTPTVVGPWADGSNSANWDNTGYTISVNASSLIGKNAFASHLQGGGTYCNVYQLLIAR